MHREYVLTEGPPLLIGFSRMLLQTVVSYSTYDADGLSEAMYVITEAGREVYWRKWDHRDRDLIGGAGLSM